MNLTELANRYGSDKGTVTGHPPHKYTYLYDLIFWPLRERPINFLEMGLAVGGPEVGGPVDRQVMSPSIRMWLDYFPQAMIYGFDISDFSHMEDSRFQFIRGDSGSSADLDRLASSAPYFDIIIDDASHASYHQQQALLHLWPRLARGGLYVIEDLQWQSPAFENQLPGVPKTANLLVGYFEAQRHTPGAVLDKDFIASLAKQTYSFSAFAAFDGTASPPKQIILRKL